MAEFSPGQKRKPVASLVIPDAHLQGARAELREVLRGKLAAEFQGGAVRNEFVRSEIRFKRGNAGKLASKLKTELDFRAALHLGEIIRRAIPVGSTLPKRSMLNSLRIDHFALPVEIGGRRALAWFTARSDRGRPGAEILDFGVMEHHRTPVMRYHGDEQTAGDIMDEAAEVLPWAAGLVEDAHREKEMKVTDRILERINRKTEHRNPRTLGMYPHRKPPVGRGSRQVKALKRPELAAPQLELTKEERLTAGLRHEVVTLYDKEHRLLWSDSDYREHSGPVVVPDGDNQTMTHQHPDGQPPSYEDLVVLIEDFPLKAGIHGTVMRIVAPQKDGSIDLYQMKLVEKLTREEMRAMKDVFTEAMKAGPDTPEWRLHAMELTIKASNGKLSFEHRRTR